MIIVVEPHNAARHHGLLEQMFRMRAQVFRDKLGWDVQVTDGMERDRYDDEGPVYILDMDYREERVRGSLRLLPTTGPTLLAEAFSDTIPDAALLSAPSIWECTRFCAEAADALEDRRGVVLTAAGTLLVGLGEVALKSGIRSIIGNFEPAMLRVYRRLGCEVEVLGRAKRQGASIYLGSFPVSAAILSRIKARVEAASISLAASPHRQAHVSQARSALSGR